MRAYFRALALCSAATLAATLLLGAPASAQLARDSIASEGVAPTYAVPPDSGCSGTFVTPYERPSTGWLDQYINLWNCTNSVKVANVMCHPPMSVVPDRLCYSVRVPKRSYESVKLKWNEEVKYVNFN